MLPPNHKLIKEEFARREKAATIAVGLCMYGVFFALLWMTAAF